MTHSPHGGEIIYCPKCGKIINDRSEFCQYCGTNILEYQSGNQSAEDRNEFPVKPDIRIPKGVTLLHDERPAWNGRMSYFSNFGLVLLGILNAWIFGLGLIFILIAGYQGHSTEYFVSDRRIFIRYEWFSRKIFDLKSEWITNVSISQSFWERVADYGDITVSTPGERGGFQRMIGVRHVMQVKSLIEHYSAKQSQ